MYAINFDNKFWINEHDERGEMIFKKNLQLEFSRNFIFLSVEILLRRGDSNSEFPGDFFKVFRFQRKTLLFSYGTFFVIKVFRLNGRPYCYSSVSFFFSKTPGRIFMKL